MKLSVMTVMILVELIGNNTAILATTAESSLLTTEATIIAQTTTEAIHTTTTSYTASTITTKTTPLPATTISNIGPTPYCKNGGIYDGIKCICPDMFYGTYCENNRFPPACQNGGIYENGICKCSSNFEGKLCEAIKEIITVDNGTTASLNVDLRFTNMEFDENLKDYTSEEYKEFEKDFKRNMNIVYATVAGFEDVKILSISNGSIIVLHEVIVRFQYMPGENIAYQFNEAHQDVAKNLVELRKNCSANPGMCIADDFSVMVTKQPISAEEQCRQKVADEFKDFFSLEFVNGNLICVSHCGKQSPRFKDCHKGFCQIEKWTGPRCFCPVGDDYLYTDNHCDGKILKLGLYIGGGVALAVLVIIIITLGICLYRVKSQSAPRKELCYETVE
ncbi:mucin-3B-like [Rana temporaria]|uniref:mucin-3B-like n=1 Tax=Rana temporaria TaxID=8407 RepID=UPI001AADE538|nr:mucin-3B-like [Rana temporaria]